VTWIYAMVCVRLSRPGRWRLRCSC